MTLDPSLDPATGEDRIDEAVFTPDLANLMPLDAPGDMRRCEAVQEVVWGIDDRAIVPAGQLMAAVHAGGLVVGAFVGRELVGFAYAFPARDPRHGHGLHSHMLAVLPGRRSGGLGRELKWFQRSWCRRRGIPWIAWTFDPLRRANARLNLEHLGAAGESYHRDVYGTIGGTLNGDLPSDRLRATWWLEHPAVAARERQGPPPAPSVEDMPVALGREADGGPSAPRTEFSGPSVWIAAPRGFSAMLRDAPERALAWRHAQRRALATYLNRGYRAERFVDDGYLLRRSGFDKERKARDR